MQKILISMLALRMEAAGLHPFHSSAIRYRDRCILFLGGEENHGKSMAQSMDVVKKPDKRSDMAFGMVG